MYKLGVSVSIGERVKELRGQTSVAEFCRTFSIHRNTLPRYESGERVPDGLFLSAICNNYKVHADWLLLGIGPKKIGDEPLASIDKDILIDAIASIEEALQNKNRVMKPEDKAEIISEIYTLISEDEKGNTKENLARLLRLVA